MSRNSRHKQPGWNQQGLVVEATLCANPDCSSAVAVVKDGEVTVVDEQDVEIDSLRTQIALCLSAKCAQIRVLACERTRGKRVRYGAYDAIVVAGGEESPLFNTGTTVLAARLPAGRPRVRTAAGIT